MTAEQFLQIADLSPEAILLVSDAGAVLAANRSFSKFLGISPAEAQGKPLADWTTDRVEAITAYLRRCVHRGEKGDIGSLTFKLTFKRSDGRTVVGRSEGTLLRPRSRNADALILLRTALRPSDAANHRPAQAISGTIPCSTEAEVAERMAFAEQRAMRLQALAAELTQSEQRERRRLARILHDQIQQLVVAAKLRVGTIRSRQVDDNLQHRLDEVERLLNLSIDASRALSTELSPPILQDGGLTAALEWLARWVEKNHGLIVEVQADPRADPAELDSSAFLLQAVRQLLFNVVQHGEVNRARVTMAGTAEGGVHIAVEDRGKGFDTAMLSGARTEGFGLFSICERLEMLGGRLEIESAPGRGTRISLFCPLPQPGEEANGTWEDPQTTAATASGPDDSEMSADPTNGTIRVLLVDDHQILRQGLVGLLKFERDIRVIGEAADGREAIERVRSLQPDVVVMDVNMPTMNGIEATRRIKQEVPTMHVIGLSLHEDQDMAASMRDAGASAYLTKGGPSEELCRAIRAARVPVN